MIRVRGRGGAPDVSVRAPRGQAPGYRADILTVTRESAQETLIALKHPQPGNWTITANPGSPSVVSVQSADAFRDPRIQAQVRGRGPRRVLTYRVSGSPGRTVMFAERGKRTFHMLGKVRGLTGRFTFTPAPGRAGRRSIIAMIDDNGAPRSVIRVASFRASRRAQLRAPTGIRL